MLLQKFKKDSEGHEAKYQLLPLIGNTSPFGHRQLVILIKIHYLKWKELYIRKIFFTMNLGIPIFRCQSI